MTAYRYRAILTGGSVVSGVIEAPSEAAVIDHVRGLGQFPVSASLATANRLTRFIAAAVGSREQLSYRQLAIATQELATLVGAGLELDRALSILERLGDLGALQKNFAAVRTRVHGGANFAEAVAAEPAFPKFFVSMVRAGELGGSLEPTLRRLSEYLARSVAVREAITSALVYPIILLATAGLSIIFILTFVLPEFRPLFSEAGQALPWPTRMLMALGDFLRGFWWALVGFAAATAIALRHWLRKPQARFWVDRYALRIPVFGALLASVDVERFGRTLGTLLSNGVPLPTALPIAADVIGNSALAAAVRESATGLREGDSFADALGRGELFPSVTLDLIRVGEETARLDEMLLRQADLDEQRIRHTVNRLLAILVPALTIVLGLMVGALIASLLTAILSINDLALPK